MHPPAWLLCESLVFIGISYILLLGYWYFYDVYGRLARPFYTYLDRSALRVHFAPTLNGSEVCAHLPCCSVSL